jgi:hypothetical protein
MRGYTYIFTMTCDYEALLRQVVIYLHYLRITSAKQPFFQQFINDKWKGTTSDKVNFLKLIPFLYSFNYNCTVYVHTPKLNKQLY